MMKTKTTSTLARRGMASTCLTLWALIPALAMAQASQLPDASLTGDDPDGTPILHGDAFAASGDTWNDWLALGAPRETATRNGAELQDGAVYIYRRDAAGEYVRTQKLTMPGSSPDAGDRFGAGLDIANGWMFIAAADDRDFGNAIDTNDRDFAFAGQVHVYQLQGDDWVFHQTLTSPNPKAAGAFGGRTQASSIAIRNDAKIAVIGETNNFPGTVGVAHSFKLEDGNWSYVATISPPAGTDHFGDALVFLDDKYLLAGGVDQVSSTDQQGFVSVYQAKGSSGQFFGSPNQVVQGSVLGPDTCPAQQIQFGESGLDVSNGIVVIAEPCVSPGGTLFAGKVHVYETVKGSAPLSLVTEIDGQIPFAFPGGNLWLSRHTVAVNDSGTRFAIGSPAGNGFPPTSLGEDVLVYADGPNGWELERKLESDAPADAEVRGFGDTVYFDGDSTVIVGEKNFIRPDGGSLKSRAIIYELDD